MYASSGGGGGGVARVTSPDSALASDVFDKFCNAVTFKSILSLYRQLCDLLRLKPTYFPLFYPKLKVSLSRRRRFLNSHLDQDHFPRRLVTDDGVLTLF